MLFICVFLNSQNTKFNTLITFVAFHPGLQSYLHTPDTGLQTLCSQLLHVSLQLFPYLPREHAKYPKNKTENKLITGKNCCFINKLIISPEDIPI
jgi:hypothetical protein